MKQFSIHKVNKPALSGKYRTGGTNEADEVADVSKVGGDGGDGNTNGGNNYYNHGEEQPSLLSIDEQ
jgi:hypothetical protein